MKVIMMGNDTVTCVLETHDMAEAWGQFWNNFEQGLYSFKSYL